jgi:hypothetical protein
LVIGGKLLKFCQLFLEKFRSLFLKISKLPVMKLKTLEVTGLDPGPGKSI